MSEASARGMTQAGINDWLSGEVSVPTRADVTLDVSGQICPVPGIRIVRALARMAPGEIIEVRFNNSMVRKMGTFAVSRGGGEVLGTATDQDGSFQLFGMFLQERQRLFQTREKHLRNCHQAYAHHAEDYQRSPPCQRRQGGQHVFLPDRQDTGNHTSADDKHGENTDTHKNKAGRSPQQSR